MTDVPKIVCQILPTIGEQCARAAYDRYLGAAKLDDLPGAKAWGDLEPAAQHVWEAVAMAAVVEYETQKKAGEVNDRWHEEAPCHADDAALRELCTRG